MRRSADFGMKQAYPNIHYISRHLRDIRLGTGSLLALAVPVFSLNLGFNEGADSLPDAIDGKRAVELLEEHFSSTLLQPARVVIDHPDVRSLEIQDAVGNLIQRLEQDPSFFGPFNIRDNNAGDLLRVRVPIAGKVDDEESENALNLLRTEIIPEIFSSTGARVYISGATADSVDFRDHM